MHVSICWNQACELSLCLPLLTWNLWSTSQLICFLKSCHRKCSAKQGMQEEIQRQTNRSVRWKKITSNANYNAVGWIHRQLVVIENRHLHIDKSHLSWQFETCCSKLLNCEHAGQQTVETARWPWYVNSSPHLLSHKESKPTYSMFKQQRFLQEMDENNRQCQDQRVRLLTASRGAGGFGAVWRGPPLTEWTLGSSLQGRRRPCRCRSWWPRSRCGWARPAHSEKQPRTSIGGTTRRSYQPRVIVLTLRFHGSELEEHADVTSRTTWIYYTVCILFEV